METNEDHHNKSPEERKGKTYEKRTTETERDFDSRCCEGNINKKNDT